MPIGSLFTVALVTACTLLVVFPQRRPPALAATSFWLGLTLNELPFVAFTLLGASTLLAAGPGDLDTRIGWSALALATLATAGLVVIVVRALGTRAALDRAMQEGLGTDWRITIEPELAARVLGRLPWARIVCWPFVTRGRQVERLSNLRYADTGDAGLLDLYRSRRPSRPSNGPVFIHLHGGRFVRGRKSRETRPLFTRLAREGWVCISANYRLQPASIFPEQLVDVKQVIAWVRERGAEYGADPTTVFVAGSSAGAHLAATAALTGNDPMFQPGFEDADTSVTGAVCLYGYYGPLHTRGPVSVPLAYARRDAPPFFVTHGDRDTVIHIEDARAFVHGLRARSSNAVVYAEIPGAQHSFDVFHSIRFENVIAAIEGFASWARAHRRAPRD